MPQNVAISNLEKHRKHRKDVNSQLLAANSPFPAAGFAEFSVWRQIAPRPKMARNQRPKALPFRRKHEVRTLSGDRHPSRDSLGMRLFDVPYRERFDSSAAAFRGDFARDPSFRGLSIRGVGNDFGRDSN
jgi:hypothetical protein